MPPTVVGKAVQAGSASQEFKKESAAARLLGSGNADWSLQLPNVQLIDKVLLVLLSLPSFIRYAPLSWLSSTILIS